MTAGPRPLPLPRLTRPKPGATRVGTFVKIAAPSVIEVLALAGLDFAVIDGEHAPFDRADIDRLVLAGVAAGLPLLVRVPDDAPATLL
jgi:2-keto-3-deoxy-L-rhamnonate aldolase RhmA